MEAKPKIKCEICVEFVEYDDNDMRPWIYHEGKDGAMHCAGANPNFWKKNRPKTYYKPAPVSAPKPKDHMLKEYFGYGQKVRKRVEDDDEIHEEDGQSDTADA